MSRWKISVDKSLCICSAMCIAIAPDRFVLDKRQRSGPVQAQIDPDELVVTLLPPARQRRSASSMPARASR